MQCTRCGSELAGSPKFCPTCGSPIDQSEEKINQEVRSGKKGRTGRVGLYLFPVVLVVGLAAFFWYINPSTHKAIQAQPVVTAPFEYDTVDVVMSPITVHEEGGDVVFSLDELKANKLVRFEYNTPTTTRPVMAYIARDGRMVTAISVSEKCTSTEFKINGRMIHCAHCPSRWDMLTLEAYSCCAKYYPDPIPSRVVGNQVHIAKGTIERWTGRM